MRAITVGFAILMGVLPTAGGAPVSGPLLGFQFDESAGLIRPVWGIPGAAWVGAPLETGVPRLGRGAVAHSKKYVLAEVRGEARVVAVDFSGDTPVCRELPGVRPGRIILSPAGTYAAVYAEDSVQVIGGLPDNPATLYESSIGPGVLALAVSDTGAVLFGVEGAVYMAEPESIRFVMPAGQPAAAVFLSNSEEALVVDRAGNTLHRAGTSPAELIAAESDGISEPAAVAISRDNRRAFVAGPGSNSVTVITLGDRAISQVSLPSPVQTLEPLAGEAVFRLTAVSEYPAWILDAEGPSARVWFIPAPLPDVTGSAAEAPR